MNTIPTEYIVARYFVKYNRLEELVSESFYGSKATNLNIYIDLYGLYKTLFSRSYRTDISDYTAFIVTVVNMCAHYRGFFRSKRVETKFFIISSYNIPEVNRKFVAEYNKTMVQKLSNQQVKEMVEINTELLDVLCPYLPDIHFFHTEYESSVLMEYIIRKECNEYGNTSPNIIISSDIYPMQLCTIFPNTVFLRPRKSKGKDYSMITLPYGHRMFQESFWRIVCLEREGLTNNRNTVSISPANYMLLMALTRFPERDFKSIINFTMANQIIYNIIGDSEQPFNVDALYEADDTLYNRFPKETLNSRYKCLALQYQSSLFEESIEAKTFHYENLQDPNAVQMINDRYFANNPIDVFKL